MTSITGPVDLGIALCKALGLDPAMTVSIDLRIMSDKLPELTVARYVSTDAAARLERMRFDIVAAGPADGAPLDLDAMCDEAMKRVRADINRSVSHHHHMVTHGFNKLIANTYTQWLRQDYADRAWYRKRPMEDRATNRQAGVSGQAGYLGGSSNLGAGHGVVSVGNQLTSFAETIASADAATKAAYEASACWGISGGGGVGGVQYSNHIKTEAQRQLKGWP